MQSFPNMDFVFGWPLGISTSSYFLLEIHVLVGLGFGKTGSCQDIQNPDEERTKGVTKYDSD